MDEQGIDVEALSINPFWYKAERDLAARSSAPERALAEICAAQPDRFVAFATVALQHPELAVEQLEQGVKKYSLRGAGLGGSVDGLELGDPKYHPFWAKAEELGVLVFIHPRARPSWSGGRLGGNGQLSKNVGNPLETTMPCRTSSSKAPSTFPGLKIWRRTAAATCPRTRRGPTRGNDLSPSLDRAAREKAHGVPAPALLRFAGLHARGAAPPGRGHGPESDHARHRLSFPWTSTSVDHILNTPGLSDADKVAMLGGTAQTLLGIPA